MTTGVQALGPLIINLAPTGMLPTREQSPFVPLSVEEIVADALQCLGEGASIVHLHARDDDGRPTYRKEIYARIIAGIRERNSQAVICVSLSGRNHPAFEQRADPLLLEGDLKPDMASLTLSSLNFPRSASVNSPETILRLAQAMADRGIKPELEVFDLGMLNYAAYLLEKGLLKPPLYFNFLLGGVATAQAKPSHLGLLMNELPAGSLWAAAGLGAAQLSMNMLGLLFGNGVRVGLEDYLWMDAGRQKLARNVDQVRRIVQLAETMGRDIATPAQTRTMLGLPS